MKILGYDYSLTKSADIDDMGRFIARDQQIKIQDGICEQQIVSTVLHEIIEALNYHNEWKLEHTVIMGLEASLYQTLCDNGVDLRPIAKEILPKEQ